jgi:hypothetical protein
VDHERVLVTRILPQRNPSGLAFAVFVVRDRNKRHLRVNTPAKCGHRLYGGFVETLGRNLKTFRIGE